jgi:hypothetical protein
MDMDIGIETTARRFVAVSSIRISLVHNSKLNSHISQAFCEPDRRHPPPTTLNMFSGRLKEECSMNTITLPEGAGKGP